MRRKKSLTFWKNIKTRLKVFLPYLILFVLVGLLVYWVPQSLIIKSISCQSQYGPCSEDLSDQLDQATGKNYREAKKITNDILQSDVGIGEYVIQLQFPDTFKVNVIERKSVFALKKNNGKIIFLVDSDGKVLKSQEATSLPLLYVSEWSSNVGDKVDEELLFALKTLYDLHQYFSVSDGVIEEDHLLAKINDGPSVILPLSGDRKVLVGSLRLIMLKLNNDPDFSIEKPKDKVIIDLRFKNPIIK